MTILNLNIRSDIKCKLALEKNEIEALKTLEQIDKWIDDNITGFNGLTLISLKKIIGYILIWIKSH